MKKIVLILLGFSLVHCAIIRTKDRSVKTKVNNTMFSARKGSELRKRIMVLPFVNLSSYPSETIAPDARVLFLEELKKTDDVILIDWKNLGINIDEFRSGATYKIEELAKRLRNSGVHAIVVGRVKDLRTGRKGDSVGIFRRVEAEVKAIAEIAVVSVRSGKVMVEESRTADATERLTRVAESSYTDETIKDDPQMVREVVFTAFEKTVPILLEALSKFSWEGRVALVRGERVYLNAGRQSGLQIGDLLRIVEEEDEVFDPQNDRFIGYIKGRMKGTVEVMSYYGNDGAVTRIHSGSGFEENDLVEFY